MEAATIKALIAGLFAWISLHTGYAVPDRHPVIAMVPHAGLEQMACTGPCPILGLYRDEGVVYLDGGLALNTNACARSILLHELVHYVQHQNGRFAEHDPLVRWQLRELEAHGIQDLFLAQNRFRRATSRNIALRAFMGPSC